MSVRKSYHEYAAIDKSLNDVSDAIGETLGKSIDVQAAQNEQLKIELLNTQETILAECAVGDKIWGIGLSMNDKKRYDMSYWKGKN